MGSAVTNGKDIWQGRPAISVNVNTSAASGTRSQQRRNRRDDANANDDHLRGDNFVIGQTHAGGDVVAFNRRNADVQTQINTTAAMFGFIKA